MRIKVCGMKFEENIREVEALQPDYLGFIFFSGSKRYVTGALPSIDEGIKKIGVFVNEEIQEILNRVRSEGLHGIQLHGEESPAYVEHLQADLKGSKVEIIKAFPVGESMDWEKLEPYERLCDYFLFDAKGEKRGGNGVQFDWNLLSGYNLSTPYFLSGGIGPDDLETLKDFMKTKEAELCKVIDVNSRFEKSPGLKNTEELKSFITDFKALEG